MKKQKKRSETNQLEERNDIKKSLEKCILELNNVVQDGNQWLETHQDADKREFEEKQRSVQLILERFTNTINR